MKSIISILLVAGVLLTACSKPSEQRKPASAGIPPELRDPKRLWCKEHNRYEDRCWLCHPDLRDKQRPYCDEHGLYEDECFLCHPELKDKKTQADAARLMCKEHGVYEDECGICHPELAGKLAPGQGLKVRFASHDSAAKAGIETAAPQIGPMADAVECYGEIAFDQNKLAQITAPVGGILRNIGVDLGSKVEDGQVLASVWSAAIGEAVAKATLARQTFERERKLRTERISSEKDLQEAEAAYQAAHQQLKTLGIDEAPTDTAVLELRAPFAGEIIERNAVRGALVEPGKLLFTLADRSIMWAMLNIPEKHLTRVRVGQEVEFTIEALPGQTFAGKLTWIAAQVDERTRMAQARAELANPDGILRAQMFARARILTGNSEQAVIVPQSAVQQLDGRLLVFVKLTDDLYEARAVRVGAKHDGRVAIAEGVRAEDTVVVTGGYIAKSQLLISRLGAGCVD